LNIAIVVQARMSSTSLPGKVLLTVGGRSLLSYQLERLRQVRHADRIVVATTVNAADDPIVEACEREAVQVTRGPELDVLRRYRLACAEVDASHVVRVTSDCPLIDPEVVDEVIAALEPAAATVDYASNMLEPSYPYGMAAEAFTARALAEADTESCDAAEREHVTPFLYRRPQRYRLRSVRLAQNLTGHRWTVDTADDFELVRRILEALYPRSPAFRMRDVLRLLDQHPDWCELNRHVRQKALGE
jgi:spore coat polysaccharide biosynthesis protein SpsF